MQTDYSEKFLRAFDATPVDGGMEFSLCGEKVRFSGDLFSYVSGGEKRSVKPVLTNNGPLLTLSTEIMSGGEIESYCYFDGEWDADEVVEKCTRLSGICVFVRKGGASFFLSLDFPYSDILVKKKHTSIGCSPMDTAAEDKPYLPHTLTVGAARLTGRRSHGCDRAEIEAFCEYIQSKMPQNFNGSKPVFTAACITNRMSDVREGRVFYSMYDNPTLTLDPETLKEEVRLMAELGVEYYQLFEGYFDWEEDGSSEKALREIVELGRSLGVRVGDYMTALELHCWHYNYHDRRVTDEEMMCLGEGGNRFGLCYASPKTREMLRKTIVESVRRNGEEMICLDGNCALPCFDVSHGHKAGYYYNHIRGLVEFISELNATSPYFMTWSNAGNWIEFMPKLLWYNQNVYLTDPHSREYESTLNCLKYYGDVRREQMVTVHDNYFVPFTAFTNCEYYAFRHSRVDDAEFFEYSFLQGLAVTPNICFGELRTFLESSPSARVPEIKAFIKKWLSFIKDNIDCWKNVYILGDAPGVGANEAYGHFAGNRGFICLVNQNVHENTFTFELGPSIGLKAAAGERFLLGEIYPGKFPLAEQRLPGALAGDEITLSVPAYSVRFIAVEPFTEPPALYGIEGKLDFDGHTGTVQISAECGTKTECAVVAPQNISEISVSTVGMVPKYTFPSKVENINIKDNIARFTVVSPRDRFKREIDRWNADGIDCRLDEQCSDFCGGYIHNFYKENQRMNLVVKTGRRSVNISTQAPSLRLQKCPVRRARVYEAYFDVPFIEMPTLAPKYGFDEVFELAFCDSAAVGRITAFINGNEVEVKRYKYPFLREKGAFYIELTDEVSSGTHNMLRLEIEWKQAETSSDKPQSPSGEIPVVGS